MFLQIDLCFVLKKEDEVLLGSSKKLRPVLCKSQAKSLCSPPHLKWKGWGLRTLLQVMRGDKPLKYTMGKKQAGI